MPIGEAGYSSDSVDLTQFRTKHKAAQDLDPARLLFTPGTCLAPAGYAYWPRWPRSAGGGGGGQLPGAVITTPLSHVTVAGGGGGGGGGT